MLLQLKAQLQKLLDSAAGADSSGANLSADQLTGSSEISDGSSAAAEEQEVASVTSSRKQEVFNEDHPFVNVAIWQLPVMPLFFAIERTAAKALAKTISESLGAVAVARR